MKRNRKKARISQCMIVKNEEKNIERALSWGKGIVSEQIVVDTGSTDRTVEIAERMGAKIYHFEWIDDFAAAKNFAIEKAKYEWVALLDADEYFSEEDAKKLLYYVGELQDKAYDAILASWVHLDNEGKITAVGTQSRVFRNAPGLRYVGRIHEFITSIDGTHFHFVDAVNELSIYHTGYGKAESIEKIKSGRNLRIIEKEIEENPDDYRMLGYLGDEYFSMQDLEKARATYQKSVDLMPFTEDFIDPIRTAMTFGKYLDILSVDPDTKEEDFFKIYDKALIRLPREGDFDYFAGKYYMRQANYPQAQKYLKRALDQLEKNGLAFKSMFLSGNIKKVYEWLTTCCYNNGNLAECINYSTMVLKADLYLLKPFFLMLTAFCLDEISGREGAASAEAVAGFLGQNLYDFTTIKDRLFVMRAAMQAGYKSLVSVMRETFSPQELTAVDRALAADKNINQEPGRGDDTEA